MDTMLGASPGTGRTIAARGVRAAAGQDMAWDAGPNLVGCDLSEKHWWSGGLLMVGLSITSPSSQPGQAI
jgi:hypothetical protein